MTSLLYLVPPCTALMAWVLFDESLTPLMMVGMALTVVGVALVVRSGRSAATEGNPVMNKPHRIAVIAGDGIGTEVMPEGVRVLEAAASRFGIELAFDHFDFASWPYYERHGEMMPADWKDRIGGHDAIFFGAVGWPDKIADHVSLWGSLLKFRRDFDLYVNLRPARLMPGVRSPLAGLAPGDIDMMIVRENTEGEYSSVGGRMFEGSDREVVDPGDGDDADRRRSRPAPCLRAGAVAAEEAPHVGDEVQRHRDHDAVLGRAGRGDGRRSFPTFASTVSTSTSSPPISCSGRRCSTSSSRAISSATS